MRGATVTVTIALLATVSALSPGATRVLMRPHQAAANAPRMCTIDEPEAPTKQGAALSLYLTRGESDMDEYVVRVLMMACDVSASDATSIVMQANSDGSARVGTWERAIAQHNHEGTARALASLSSWSIDLKPAYVHRSEALAAVKQYGDALKYASLELQSDREAVLAAVQQDGFALRFASEALREDREVVLAAVRQDGNALEFASLELQADCGVVLAAVVQDGDALQYASQELRADREVMLAVVQQDGRELMYASEALRADREVVLAAVQQDGLALIYASVELQADREVVLAAVQQYGGALKFASEELRADREVVVTARRCGNMAMRIRYASEEG